MNQVLILLILFTIGKSEITVAKEKTEQQKALEEISANVPDLREPKRLHYLKDKDELKAFNKKYGVSFHCSIESIGAEMPCSNMSFKILTLDHRFVDRVRTDDRGDGTFNLSDNQKYCLVPESKSYKVIPNGEAVIRSGDKVTFKLKMQ